MRRITDDLTFLWFHEEILRHWMKEAFDCWLEVASIPELVVCIIHSFGPLGINPLMGLSSIFICINMHI